MTTFTDKELIKEIKERISSLDVRDNIERRAYEIAQASLVAEPVAYQYRQWDAEYDEWGEWEDCGESAFERFVEEEKCLGAGVQTRKLYTAPPVHQPGGFTIEETQELYEDLVRSHISQALSGEKMKKKDRDADLRWIHGVIVQAAWFVKASLEALPEPPQEVNQ